MRNSLSLPFLPNDILASGQESPHYCGHSAGSNRNPGNNDSLLSKAGIFYTGFGEILCSPFYSEQTNANFNPIHANLSSQIPAAAVLLRHSFQGNRIDSSARNVSLLQTNF